MRLPLIVAAAAVVALCAACTNETSGQATGTSPNTPSSPAATTTAPPSVTSTSADPGMKGKTEFTQEELCTLLTSDESQQLGASAEGKPTMNVVTEAQVCQWSDETVIIVGYRPNAVTAGLESGPTITKSKIKINGIPAILSDNKKPGGICQVGIDLTDHSELVVAVGVHDSSAGKWNRCDTAKTMANIVFSRVK
jgi:uncharacterized protein DUF3558